MNLRVDTHIAGSKVVVWRNREHYIDAREDYRFPKYNFIEVVHSGRVRIRELVHVDASPERIIELMRNELT